MIHRYIPKAKRKARSRRMLAAKEEKRLARGIDADTARWRALHPVPVAERSCPIFTYDSAIHHT